ncbi:MAG TPA: hypothetical protein VJY15_07095, partial [Candidatus Acidoferrum sp.]|nr:hypothetical protein [Candidatus Acidoferrum sp.]
MPVATFAGEACDSRTLVSLDPPAPDPTPSSPSLAAPSAVNACRRCAGLSLPIPVSQCMNSTLSTKAS